MSHFTCQKFSTAQLPQFAQYLIDKYVSPHSLTFKKIFLTSQNFPLLLYKELHHLKTLVHIVDITWLRFGRCNTEITSLACQIVLLMGTRWYDQSVIWKKSVTKSNSFFACGFSRVHTSAPVLAPNWPYVTWCKIACVKQVILHSTFLLSLIHSILRTFNQ